MLLHELGHVEAYQRLLRTKQKFRKAAGNFRLSDTSRPEEKEAAHRTQRGLEARAAAADGASKGSDGPVLADDALVEFRLDAQEFLLFVFLDGSDADAGPARNDLFNVFAGHDARRGVVQLEAFAESAQVFLFLALLLRVETRFFEFVIGDGRFHAVGDEFHALLHFADFFGDGGLAQLHARAGFIDQVDGLVRKKPVRDVAVRKINRVAQRFVRVADSVEFFVALANTLDHLHRLLFVRRGNLYGLEAALQRAIFLHRLAVFARRCRANALNLSARERGFQNVGGVQRAFRGTGAHEGVQLVDEHDGVLALHQFFHDRLQPLFELAAVFRARHDQGKIEGKDALVRQEGRHIAVGNALRQALNDRGLADAGLADQHRIILGAPAQNLDDALDFAFAANERIQ